MDIVKELVKFLPCVIDDYIMSFRIDLVVAVFRRVMEMVCQSFF